MSEIPHFKLLEEEGFCKLCGECCRWLCIGKEEGNDEEFRKWVRYRQGRIRDGYVFLPSKCDMLESGGRCAVQDAKPQYCREFPKHKPEYLKALGCKYYD